MKNLLVYINPEKEFLDNNDLLVKLQIDNSLGLGWKKEEILLATNFPYEYAGVKATIVGDDNYCSHHPNCNKISAIVDLFQKRLISEDLYWFHDLDAYQMEADIDPKIGNQDMAIVVDHTFVPYGDKYPGTRNWTMGVIYFNHHCQDIFNAVRYEMDRRRCSDDMGLKIAEYLQRKTLFPKQLKALNLTYNFQVKATICLDHRLRYRHFGTQYDAVEKPIKVIHFPLKTRWYRPEHGETNNIDFCIRGKNPMKQPLVSPRLLEIFKKYGIS